MTQYGLASQLAVKIREKEDQERSIMGKKWGGEKSTVNEYKQEERRITNKGLGFVLASDCSAHARSWVRSQHQKKTQRKLQGEESKAGTGNFKKSSLVSEV